MTQPIHDLNWAPDAVYPSGAGAYTGLSNKTRPSDAEQEMGIVPGERFPAQWENYIKSQQVRAMESILDICALNYPHQIISDTAPPTAAPQSDTRLVAAQLTAGGATAEDMLLFTDTSTGTVAYLKWDTNTSAGLAAWANITDPTLTISSNVVAGKVAGLPTVIIWESDTGTVKKAQAISAWTAAGTFTPVTATGPDSYNMGIYVEKEDRWVLVRRANIAYSDDLVTWTAVSLNGIGWTGAPPLSQQALASGSDGILIALAGTKVVYSNDAATWSYITSPNLVAIDWSESRQEWIGVTSIGQVYTAPPGAATWTAQVSTGLGTAFKIKAFGRCYVLGTDEGLFVAQKAAGPWVQVLKPISGGFEDLVLSGGRLIAAEQVTYSTLNYLLYPSLRAPWLVF